MSAFIDQTVFQDVKMSIKNQITENSYNTAIKDLILEKVLNDTIYIQAPSNMVKNIVEGRYITPLKEKFLIATSMSYDIVITTKEKQTPEQTHNQVLPKDKIFEEFIEGKGNQHAMAASMSVAKSPASGYNPLFIYGSSGLGKTHLLQAIGNYVMEHNKNAKVCYVPTDKFTRELIDAISEKDTSKFKAKYRHLDFLIIDDIQELSGKESTQNEFFHTFNELHDAGKQIVIASDKPPKDLKTLENRLTSRFNMGIIVDIKPPDYETRIAILKKKAERDHIIMDNELYYLIAEKITSNIRDLEGVLNKVKMVSILTRDEITKKTVDEILNAYIDEKENKRFSLSDIKSLTADYYQIRVEDIDLKKRTKEIANARQVAMYIARETTDLSFPKLGEEFGGRDHSTVKHACDKVKKLIETDNKFRFDIEKLLSKIRE